MYAKYDENPQQVNILQELKDMFSSMPHWRLREVCKANNWHLESCIDQLMNVPHDIKEVKNSQQDMRKEYRNDINKNNFSKDEERIGSLIKNGYRIMILMRGPPGVGKTYLAQSLVNNNVDLENFNYNIRDFICSSDDYFYDAKGVYKYNSTFITNAHEFNHQRVQNKAKSGLSPIIVDNTNMQLWEMLPYVKHAVQNNYLIEILEPKTPWRNSCSILAQKNKHNVPRNRIQQIMEKYEKASVASLTRMLKNTKYTSSLPQLRTLPPIKTAQINYPLVETDDISPKAELLKMEHHPQDWGAISTTEPKEQRKKLKSMISPSKSYEQEYYDASTTRNVYSLLEEKTTNAWKPFESESTDFWGVKPPKALEQRFQLGDSRQSTSNTKSLLDLLREDSADVTNKLKTLRQDGVDEKKYPTSFERHGVGCPNEETAFTSLRQIYPNKNVSGLWDLFVKCNGDVTWVVDILLKEDELEGIRCDDDDVVYQPENDELFECLCNSINKNTAQSQDKNIAELNIGNILTSEQNIRAILNPTEAKPQRHRLRPNQRTNAALLDIKENIENCFVLGDDKYSKHLHKIRCLRSGVNDVTGCSNAVTKSYENVQNVIENPFNKNEDVSGKVKDGENAEDYGNVEYDEDIESDNFDEEMLEMSLGEQLIQQLLDTFGNESFLEKQIPSTLPINLKIFLPRSLAKQLYMLWIESAYNHMEEERQKIIKEDEDFARLIKNPKYSEFKQSPSNIHELLDMEYAWKIYNQEKDEQQQRDIEVEKIYMPKDLASHLTQMKLCESFPDIPRETLLDMLATNGNDYNTTVAVIRSTMEKDDVSTTEEHLKDYDREEQDLVNQQVQNQIHQSQKEPTNSDDTEQKSALLADEAKRLALREFEESRNLAAHHCQLKAECYQKAKEAIQSGNGGAAIYYSQIANFHIKKIDMYNHRAANCIMDVHKNTQNNPDLLDLHYLYLIEALGCLDLFLDRHITSLRIESRNYKHVFIITGRGKHSAGGVSTIKNKVKARLKERCLRWSEVNPGLLKVKIFSGSRHSKNI